MVGTPNKYKAMTCHVWRQGRQPRFCHNTCRIPSCSHHHHHNNNNNDNKHHPLQTNNRHPHHLCIYLPKEESDDGAVVQRCWHPRCVEGAARAKPHCTSLDRPRCCVRCLCVLCVLCAYCAVCAVCAVCLCVCVLVCMRVCCVCFVCNCAVCLCVRVCFVFARASWELAGFRNHCLNVHRHKAMQFQGLVATWLPLPDL